MRRVFFIFCMFCIWSAFGQSNTNETKLVLSNMKAQEQSWNNGDVRSFMDHYWKSDSLKFIGSKGITYGWQKTYDNYLRAYPNKEEMGELTFTIIEATALSEQAVYVIGKWELKKEKPAGGHFTLLWKKIDGKWVIVADHTS